MTEDKAVCVSRYTERQLTPLLDSAFAFRHEPTYCLRCMSNLIESLTSSVWNPSYSMYVLSIAAFCIISLLGIPSHAQYR